MMVRKTHDYVHYYRGYWSDGGRCRVRIYREQGSPPVVICYQLPENDNTSVTNMAEYLDAEIVERQGLSVPVTWVEHYREHEGWGNGRWSSSPPGRWRRYASAACGVVG